MNTIQTPLSLRTFFCRALLAVLILGTATLYAQTASGREYLAETPSSLRAYICPDGQKASLTVRAELPKPGGLHIRLINEKRETVYDDFVAGTTAYAARFDVSTLPYGRYTVELSSRIACHIQDFWLEAPTDNRRIVMAGSAAIQSPKLPTN
jgi:hypothetical protein